MDYEPAKILAPALSANAILLGLIGRWVAKSFERLVNSIDKLNINVAVIVEKINTHEKRIKELEKRRH